MFKFESVLFKKWEKEKGNLCRERIPRLKSFLSKVLYRLFQMGFSEKSRVVLDEFGGSLYVVVFLNKSYLTYSLLLYVNTDK